MNRILSGLNPAQKEAIETLSGPLLILAGAGSGKTKTLTHRIANLIDHGIPEDRILAVTFTNKAAREMRERLWKLLSAPEADDFIPTPPRSFMPYMGTFHSIAVRILRQEADTLDLDPNFVIYDVTDQITLIKRIMKSHHIEESRSLKAKSIQSAISAAKNQGLDPDDYAKQAFYPNQKTIAQVFAYYEQEKRQISALDFDDLLLYQLHLLQSYPKRRRAWQEKFRHILIDEYQDTNTVQYQIVKLLVGPGENLCVVGDDWQSIYSWRGADFRNILNFTRDFPRAKVIKLERNYRSTGNILTAAQKIIEHNKTRTDKTLFTEAGQGDPVEIHKLADELSEASYVAEQISHLLTKHPDYGDFAILYRTNAQSYAFERIFMTYHLPYKIIGGVRFYDRREVKDVLALLHLIQNQRDKVSLERIAKNILSGVGEVSLSKILDALDAISGSEPLFDPDLLDCLNAKKARQSLAKLISFLKKVQKSALPPGEIVKLAVSYFDFAALFADDSEEEDRMANLDVLASNASMYDTLAEFLADTALMSSADESSEQNSVTLMTMHAAKGLEFPVVFLVGMEEGLFPSSRIDNSEDPEASLEEERRLAYVGMTRAMQQLFLTYAGSRLSYGERGYRSPSRFLREIGYNPYGSNDLTESPFDDEDDFDDFDDFNDDIDITDPDPFPEDLPFYD